MKVLLPIAWSVWGAGILGILYIFFVVATEKTSSPEASRGLGIGLVLFLFLLSTAGGFALRWAASRQSVLGVIVMTLVLGYPYVVVIANRVIRNAKEKKYAAEFARIGDFPDPKLQALAARITANDPEGLKRELNGQRPPSGVDRAGNTLLAYTSERIRFHSADLVCLGALLDTGMDPNAEPLLDDFGANPAAVKLLLAAGASINGAPAATPPVVHFIGNRNWESALLLIEAGADLDWKNADGLSVDYYLKQWKDDIYSAPIPDGWNRVRAAIAKRRSVAAR